MNIVKKTSYGLVGAFLLLLNNVSVFARDTSPDSGFGLSRNNMSGEEGELEVALQRYINYLLTFLYILAVGYALWGGFQILTAGGDEDKVTKGKTILIQGAIGLLVIWLAGTIVKFVLRVLVGSD